jgi:hypothetical protein
MAREPKGYTPKEIFQKIESEDLWETDLEFDPEHIPWIYIGNIIQRTLSRMIGQGPYGPVTVKCTKEGNLAVVTRGGAFDDYERLEHVFTAAKEVHEFNFSQQVERIDIFTYSDRVDYQLSRDLTKAYGDKIELFEDSFYSLDFYTRKVYATCVSYSPKVSSSADGTTASHLIDSTQNFSTDSLCSVGDYILNTTDNTNSVITAVADGDLTLADDIFVSGENYVIDPPRTKLMGWFQAID